MLLAIKDWFSLLLLPLSPCLVKSPLPLSCPKTFLIEPPDPLCLSLSLPPCLCFAQDYESCVRRGDKECTYADGDERDDFGQLTEFFCGQDDECT